MGFYGVSSGIFGVPMGFYEFQGIFGVSNGILWVPMGFLGFPM